METLKTFVPSRGRLQQTLSACEKFGFYTAFDEKNNFANRVCHFINKNKQISLLQTSIDFCDAMKHPKNLKRTFSRTKVSYYVDNEAYEQSIGMRIHDLMLSRQTIFIIMDLERYLLVPKTNKYDTHSVCVILHPTSENNYNMFYINSHGRCLFGDTDENDKEHLYNIVTFTTKTRTKWGQVQLPHPPDFVLMKAFHSYIQHIVEMFVEPEFIIHYNMSEKHNYLGCNIQAGDNHGICFLFPYVIWYYLSNYFTTSRSFGKITIPSIEDLLKAQNLNFFVPSCFVELSAGFGKIVTQKKMSDDKLEEYLSAKQTCFLKQILCPFINFMTQPYFVEKFYK